MLLVVSYYFYMSWNYKLVVLILTTTLISFFGAKLVHQGKSPKKVMIACAVVCLGILGFF